MQNELFEAALGVAKPWYVNAVDFDTDKKTLTISIDFVVGTRFPAAGVVGEHPVHDTQIKRMRHLNFFQHECFLDVRTPRVKTPDGKVVQYEPDWFGKLAGFTLLFEALVLAMAQQMTFAAVAKLVGESSAVFISKQHHRKNGPVAQHVGLFAPWLAHVCKN